MLEKKGSEAEIITSRTIECGSMENLEKYIYICSLLQLNKRKDCVVMGIELNISKVCPSILSFCIVKVNKNKFFFTLREN